MLKYCNLHKLSGCKVYALDTYQLLGHFIAWYLEMYSQLCNFAVFDTWIQHCLLQIKVREGSTDWGWGVVVNVVKRPSAGLGTARGGGYIVDTLLHCSPGSSENGARPKPCPPCPGEKGEMHVVS